jgi:hypothetical protein
MFSKVTFDGSTFLVHSTEASQSVTSAFSRGTITIRDNTISFGKAAPVPLEFSEVFTDGFVPKFQLLNMAGEPKKQIREDVVIRRKDGTLTIPGKSQSDPVHPAEDGWQITVHKFRAYVTHPGVETDPNPLWLEQSVERMRMLWNRLAWRGREARRASSTEDPAMVKEFIHTTFFPMLDDFNNSFGMDKTEGKFKLKRPKTLTGEEPTSGAIWGFIKAMEKVAQKDRPVPDELVELSKAFIANFKVDFTPHNAFVNGIVRAVEEEMVTLNFQLQKAGKEPIRTWEVEQVADRFSAAIKRRRKDKLLAFSKGWPRIKYPDQPGFNNWALRRVDRSGGRPTGELFGKGAIYLKFGPKIAPTASGHSRMALDPQKTRQFARRHLRQVEISMPTSDLKVRETMRLVILQHRELPEEGVLKGWQLVHEDGEYHLCLTMQVKLPQLVASTPTAGLDIGWRVLHPGKGTGDTLPTVLRVGILYDPETGRGHEIRIDGSQGAARTDEAKPQGTPGRHPFTVQLGSNRWVRRNAQWNRQHAREIMLNPYLRRQAEGDFHSLRRIAQQRSTALNDIKAQVATMLSGELPGYWPRVGTTWLRKYGAESQRTDIHAAITAWAVEDARIQKVHSFLYNRLSLRLAKGYEYVANDLCRFLTKREEPILRLAIEEDFLKKVAEKQDNFQEEALKAQQRMRQWASLSTLMAAIANAARRYGIAIVKVAATHTTLTCSVCGTVAGEGSGDLLMKCVQCGSLMDQDLNAARNLAHAAQPVREEVSA